MNTQQDLIAAGRSSFFPNYRQPEMVLVRGEGDWVFDHSGKRYLDLISGIATCTLGHAHPKLVEALRDQAGRLWHVSNLYWNEPAIRLASRLCETSFAESVFFCNSGAEANEGALKLARRYHHDKGAPRQEILSFEKSFHGRTIGALMATGQPKYHVGFEPLPEGYDYLPFGEVEAFDRITEKTAAVIVEPIQGEGGLVIPPEGYLRALRARTEEVGALLILDEVQSGMGRTGVLWAHQREEVVPDMMTCAKGLGGGFPVGALLARAEVAASFVPGTHASTFGGNALATRAALTVLEVLLDDGVLEASVVTAERLWDELRTRLVAPGHIAGLRGIGMWVGLEVPGKAVAFRDAALEAGLLVNALGADIVRLAPALTFSEEARSAALEGLEAVATSL